MRVVMNKGKPSEFTLEIEGVQGVDNEKIMCTLAEMFGEAMKGNYLENLEEEDYD